MPFSNLMSHGSHPERASATEELDVILKELATRGLRLKNPPRFGRTLFNLGNP